MMHRLECACAPGCRARGQFAELAKQERIEYNRWLDRRAGVRVGESRLMKSIREQEERSQ